MENNFSKMSNAEIKLHLKKLENEFESKKKEIVTKCDEMKKIEDEYLMAENELNLRKNILG